MLLIGRDEVPARLKAIRGRLGASQRQYASLLGISQSTLSRWERGVGKLPVLFLRIGADGSEIPELMEEPDDLPFGPTYGDGCTPYQ